MSRAWRLFSFGAIVVRPSSSVVVSRRPSLPCARVCVYVVCFHVRGPCDCGETLLRQFCRARAVGGPRDVLNFFRFYFCSRRPARRGFLRKSTPLSVRNRGSIFNRIPAGHGTGVPDTQFFFRWTVWPSFKKT